jgi:hypothetical protein
MEKNNEWKSARVRRSLRRQLPLAAVLGGVMTKLSDNLRPIVNSRAIENGRYAGADHLNQNLISIIAGAAWPIAASQHPSHSRTYA